MRILVAEDDSDIAAGVRASLQRQGHAVDHANDGAKAEAALASTEYDLLILDLGLPSVDGRLVLQRLRQRGKQMPVLVITARDGLQERIQTLDLGADDYIAKPFGMAELVARVKALLRRSGMKTGSDRLVCGELTVDVAKHTVTVGTANVQLTYKEFSLLVRLMESAGRAFTREQLLETVWGYDYEGGTRTVDVHVQTLRTKLGESGKYIETVRGVGYRFGE